MESKIFKYEEEIKNLKGQIEILETAFESSYDGIHVLDKNGTTLRINKACERIEGLSEEEAKTKNIKALVKEGIYNESVTLKVIDTKKTVTIIQKVKNGKDVLTTGTPIYKNGEIDKVIVNSRDITELNILKRELLEKDKLAKKYHSELQLLRLEQLKIENIIAQSSEMKSIISIAINIAKVESTVLISGESGVGKGVLCKFIHNNSKRKKGPFIKIDCGSIPETLLESELFGYEKGAFTGSSKEGKIGLVELADGGTLFLDEIGEMPLYLQVKILRMIQDKEIMKVGGTEPIPVDIRIIAATNKELEEMVKEKKFRVDLYYRLNVIPIKIPPLRERKEDIQPLILKVLEKINQKYSLSKKVNIEAMDCLISYDWLGNVRELENIIERIVVTVNDDEIGVEDLPEVIKKNSSDTRLLNNITSYKSKMDEFEKKYLIEVMKKANSTQEMADILKIDVTSVRRKLNKHNIVRKFR